MTSERYVGRYLGTRDIHRDTPWGLAHSASAEVLEDFAGPHQQLGLDDEVELIRVKSTAESLE